jgi:hypothetical protein
MFRGPIQKWAVRRDSRSPIEGSNRANVEVEVQVLGRLPRALDPPPPNPRRSTNFGPSTVRILFGGAPVVLARSNGAKPLLRTTIRRVSLIAIDHACQACIQLHCNWFCFHQYCRHWVITRKGCILRRPSSWRYRSRVAQNGLCQSGRGFSAPLLRDIHGVQKRENDALILPKPFARKAP